ncbi:hypothetical protein GHT06_019608 [Daphnia sinensis]|uniref:Uncharacterized protein n=1 Tax=Daphnia sinensis TaxID=1820382 RepID=A0AAD5L1M0_9CRUS|nr:hypothetical protein GHT06_019608 [Daphnia sinensis]
MKSLAACVSLFVLLAAQIESRATTPSQQLSISKSISKVSRIHRHHHQTGNSEHDVDDPTQELAVVQAKTDESIAGETASRMVKRSTETPLEKPLTIDWKLIVAYLTEMALKLIEFISNNFKTLQQRLMHFLVPFFSTISDQQPSGHPAVAATTSVDWRSAGTALFNTLLKYQSLRKNEVW